MKKLSFVTVNVFAAVFMAFGLNAAAAEVGEFIPETEVAEVEVSCDTEAEETEAEISEEGDLFKNEVLNEEETVVSPIQEELTVSGTEETAAVEEATAENASLTSNEGESVETGIEEFFNAGLSAEEADRANAGTVDVTATGKVLAEAQESQEEEFVPETPEEIIPQEPVETPEEPQDLQPVGPVVSNNDEETVDVVPADSIPQATSSVEEAQPDAPKVEELPKTEDCRVNMTRNCQTGDTDILVVYGAVMALSLVLFAVWMTSKKKYT